MALHEIYTAQDLKDFRDLVNAGNLTESAILMNDIDLEGTVDNQWVPIGTNVNIYSGTFDGNGYSISNLYIDKFVAKTNYCALIASCSGIIRNLTINNAVVAGGSYTAIIVASLSGSINNCTINNCSVNGSYSGFSSSYNYIGGISAYVVPNNTVISNCNINNCIIKGYNYVGTALGTTYGGSGINLVENINIDALTETYARHYIGGIFGSISNNFPTHWKIDNCINNGSIVATGDQVGGIVGTNAPGIAHSPPRATIINCINRGTIQSRIGCGGIIGNCISINISFCINEGDITSTVIGDSSAGGIVGTHFGGSVTYCTNSGNITGDIYIGGIISYTANTCIVDHNTNTGQITGNLNTGGIVGIYSDLDRLTVSNNVNHGVVSGITNTGPIIGGTKYATDWTNSDILNIMNNYYLVSSCPNMNTPVIDGQIYSYPGPDLYVINQISEGSLIEIYTAQDLKDFRDLVNNGTISIPAILMNDIDLEGSESDQWIPINNYNGEFDGNGHTISGLYIKDIVGPIGFISTSNMNCVIKKLKLEGEIILTIATNDISGFIGYNNGSLIVNCLNKINITSTNDTSDSSNIGSFTGNGYNNVTIKNCVNEGTINILKGTNVGGILGSNSGTGLSIIDSCLNKKDIIGLNNVGGIVGYDYHCVIKNCVNLNDITGNSYVGGIVGYFKEPSTINNCTNSGSIVGNSYVGGIVGYVWTSGGTTNNSTYIYYNANANKIAIENSNCARIIGFFKNGSNSWSHQNIYKNFYNTFTLSSYAGVNYVAINFAYVSKSKISDLVRSYRSDDSNLICSAIIENIFLTSTADVEITLYPTPVLKFNNGDLVYSYYTSNSVQYSNFNVSDTSIAEIVDNHIHFKSLGSIYVDYTVSFVFYPDISYNASATSLGSVSVNDKYIECNSLIPTNTITEISTVQELKSFRDLVNSGEMFISAILMNDIDLQGSESDQWVPIGNTTNTFKTIFDGNGYTISGIYINNDILDNQGFIGFLDSGVVKNLTIEGNISGNNYLGGIVGKVFEGKIENCINRIQINGNSYIGGIVGYLTSDQLVEILDCVNEVEVSGSTNSIYCGGIVGTAENCNIINCINKSNVTGYENVSGIVSEFYSGNIINCVNIGNITAVNQIASGIVNTSYSSDSIIRNCVNMGIITGPNYIAGIIYHVANSNDIYVQNCVNEGNIVCDGDCYGAIYGKIESNINNTSHNYYLDISCNKAGYIYDADIITTIDEVFETYTSGNAPAVACFINSKTNENPTEIIIYPYYNRNISKVSSINNFTADTYHILTEIYIGRDENNNIIYRYYWQIISTIIASQLDTYIYLSRFLPSDLYVIRRFNSQCDISFTFNDINLGTVNIDKLIYNNQADTYNIKLFDAQNLKDFRDAINDNNTVINASAILMNDIDLEGSESDQWIPINNYKGITFDGNNHVINGLYIDKSNTSGVTNQGFFGSLYGTVAQYIKNLTIIGTIKLGSNASYVGGFIGKMIGVDYRLYIENCINKINITLGENSSICGGIIGIKDRYLNITNCVNEGNISGPNNCTKIGGIVGQLYSSENNIMSNINRGTIIAGNYVGGIIGSSSGKTWLAGDYEREYNIKDNINEDNITGIDYVGGIIGFNDNDTVNREYYYMINCVHNINKGSITGVNYIGGIQGFEKSHKSKSIYRSNINYGVVSGTTKTGAIIGSIEDLVITTDFENDVLMQKFTNGLSMADNYYMKNSCVNSIGVPETKEINFRLIEFDNSNYNKFYTDSNPRCFEIYNANDLDFFGLNSHNGFNHWNVSIMSDINLNGNIDNQWIIINNYDHYDSYYQGVFNGNGHTISGIYINRTAGETGFFCAIVNATIKNLIVEGNILGTDYSYIGAIVGYAEDSVIENCINRINIDLTDENDSGYNDSGYDASGICNYVYGSNIIHCINEGTIKGNSWLAGIVNRINNYNKTSIIENCINKGNIIGSYFLSGISNCWGELNIVNCVNEGNIYAESFDGKYFFPDQIASISTDYINNIVNCVNEGNIYITVNQEVYDYYIERSYLFDDEISAFSLGNACAVNCVNEGKIIIRKTDNSNFSLENDLIPKFIACHNMFGHDLLDIGRKEDISLNNYYLDINYIGKPIYDSYNYDLTISNPEKLTSYTEGNAPNVASSIEDFRTNKKIITPKIYPDINTDITDITFSNWSVSGTINANIENDTVVLAPTVPKKEIIIDKL